MTPEERLPRGAFVLETIRTAAPLEKKQGWKWSNETKKIPDPLGIGDAQHVGDVR